MVRSQSPAAENLVWALSVSTKIVQAHKSFCHATRLHRGNVYSVARLRCAEQSSPEAGCGAPKAQGLTANAQIRAIIIVAATSKRYLQLFDSIL